MDINKIVFQNDGTSTPNNPPSINNIVDENSIPAFTVFEVFPRFTKVDAGTTSNVEVNFDAMFSGTNQWNINKNYVSSVYVTQYDKDNPLSSKIYKSIQPINSSDQINITNTDYWQDETSTYFEILTNNNGELKAYHKYINAIPARYTHAIRIKSSYDPNHQNVIIDWGDGTIVELSSAKTLLENEELSNILGSTKDGKNDIIVIEPPTDTTLSGEQFGKNTAYEYYCYHDYMPAMVTDGIVIVTINDDGTSIAEQGLPDKPYKVTIYGNSYFGIGKDGGVRINHYIKPEDAITGERSIYSEKGFNNILISRLFEADLPFYQYSNITIASLANNAPNLLYINLPKYYDGFDGVINTYEAFKNCKNLQYCNGFNNKMRFKSLRGMCRMFSGCINMLKCDIKLAKIVVDHHVGSVHDGNKAIFENCPKLAVDLLSLLPLDGFSSRYMSLINTFNGCRSLDTTLENTNIIKYILWKDTTKEWKCSTKSDSSTAAFYGCAQINSLKITTSKNKLINFIPNGWKNSNDYQDLENNDISPLTFKSLGDSTISLNKIGNPDIIQLEYSINNSEYKPYTINDTITLYNEWELKIRATDVSNERFSKNSDNYYKFVMTGQIEASGNIQTLLNQSNTDKAPAYCYIKLFKDCTSLINIKSLNLPATILNEHCYDSMFENCNQIYTAITLDADILSDYCYANMFYGCSLLTNMPTLNAKTLAIGCYKSMFENCTSLYNIVDILPTDTLKDNCYDSMFKNCSELTCTVIELPAKELVSKCYYEMFSGCSKLSSISVKFTEWKEDLSATTNWVTNVATTGLFVAPNILPDIYDNSHIPDTWENEEYKEPEIEIPFNSEYGEMKIGLGENNDEVAVIFKNSDLANMEWTAPCDLENVQFLVVGGGGGGGGAVNSTKGGAGGAGGGGGCVVTGIVNKINKNDIVSIQIGKGGNGGTYYNGTTAGKGNASHGGNSIFKVNDITYITAFGGAGDLGYNKNSGVNNGSNSGSRYNGTTASAVVRTAATWDQTALSDKLSNVITYRNKGGYNPENKGSASGGGGGACGVGYNVPSSAYGGYGGVGLLTNITGDDVMFGSGGGGGTSRNAGTVGYDSNGGGDNDDTGFCGGAGEGRWSGNGEDALANQGGGGGGAGYHGNGGNGGSGIVVLRFKATNINIDPSYIKIKLTAPNNNYNINTVSDKINNAINENEDNSTFLSASTYYSYDTEYRIAAAEDASKNSIPIEFKWKNSIGDTTLKLWRTKDIESNPDAIPLFQTTSSNNYAIYYDPEVGRNYTYELSDSVGNVTRDIFYTSQRVPRVIYENQDPTTDGAEASNTRDIGGWLTIDGTKMVKQGMIYRSAMLEWCSPLADQNIISPNIYLQDNLGIRVELELRDYDHVKKHFIDDGWKCSWKSNEAMSITDSTIGPKVERYCPNANGYAAFPSYSGMFSTDSKKAVYAAFNKIYESIIDNKPVLFHCSQGKDRTGCLAYILLGMLGVSELNAKRDYGFTYYSQNKDDILMTSTDGYGSLKTNVLDKLPTGSTFQDRCKAYIKQCGEAVGDSDIDTKITNFIEFMLEDVEEKHIQTI